MSDAGAWIALVAPLLLGAAMSARGALRRRPIAAVAEAWIDGMALLGGLLVLMARAGAPLTATSTLTAVGAAGTALWITRGILRRRAGPAASCVNESSSGIGSGARNRDGLNPGATLGGAVIGVALLLAAAHGLLTAGLAAGAPPVGADAYENWLLRARVIAVRGELPLDPASPYYLGGGRVGYPLGWPMLAAWPSILSGRWSDRFANLYGPAYLAALALLVAASVRERLGGAAAAAALVALLGLPLAGYQAARGGYADLPLAVHLTAGCAAMWDGSRGSRGRAASGGINLLFVVLLKREGLALFLVMLAGWFVGGRLQCVDVRGRGDPPWPPLSTGGEKKAAAAAAGAKAAMTAAAAVAAMVLAGLADLSYVGREAGSIGLRMDAIRPMMARLFTQDSWGVLWWIVTPLIAVAAARLRRREPAAVLQAGGLIGFVAFVFLFTANADFAINGWTFDRSVLQIAPAMMLFAAAGVAPDGTWRMGSPPSRSGF